MTTLNIILLITALATALIAGLFYSYSVSVNPGLGQLSDANYLASMQSINQAILNPLFFCSFMGTLILLPVSSYLHYSQPLSIRFYCLLAASLVYAIGTFGVTMFGNVPLNDALAKFDLMRASSGEMTLQRLKFEKPWNQLHSVRTIASVIALVLVLAGCLSGFEKE